ncbi:speckle-type POZ protein-like B [Trichonephila inaurata madagascariensis]|uniref:Speckle-type POZ protein-like B n=1 Tax=Trichonephila inaurata madagascariensis TaxID=2747483 RepID=A0A8X6WW11_9ARAC|nr:speckle-type POZ protein-like B [Trichonephila inaurata madagascariensis]
MLCWFSKSNKDVPDHIEIRRNYVYGTSYVSGELVHQTVDKQTLWRQEFSLDIIPGWQSEMLNIQYDVMDAKSTLFGYVIISDKPKANNEKDIELQFLRTLSNDFARLMDPKYTSLADVHLKCGSVSFPAHKNILSVRSPFFSDMFSSKVKETQKNVVIIPDIDPPVFRIILMYIYTGKLAADLTLPLVGDLLFATNKYKLTGLITACYEYLKVIISMENAIDILELGDLYDPGVKALALEFLCKNIYNFGILEETEKWKNLQKKKSSLAFEVLTSLVKSK